MARRCRLLLAAGLGVLASACGAVGPAPGAEHPTVVLPARLPPAQSGSGAASAAGAAGSRPAASTPGEPASAPRGLVRPTPPAAGDPEQARRAVHGDLPDPEPLSERAQWSFPVLYDRGSIHVAEPELSCSKRPRSTPRRLGRFAFELWLGRELIDRLRFDFPLLATEEPPVGPRRPLRETPRFAPGARVSVTLQVPASERATSARILDRATGDVVEVSWPPRSPDGATRPRECPGSSPAAGVNGAAPRPSNAGR